MKKTISGIRGIFGKDFNLKDVLFYCNNFASLITKSCVIGRDTRPSSSIISEIVKSAIMQNGIKVYDLGIAPTPVIYRESRRYDAGVIITASHNPINWNGLKFIINGMGVNQSQLDVILKNQDLQKNPTVDENITTKYLEEASSIISKTEADVVVDLGGGAARYFAPNLLKKIGCNVNTINDTLQTCNRNTDPTSDNLEQLVSYNKLGFAFDLDGDRLVVVNNGIKQSPDITLALGVAKSINLGYKKFVLSVDSSVGIEKFIKERGGTTHRSKVGETNVVNLMLKTSAQAGGEGSSGGFIFPEFNYCRDGILTSGFIASISNEPIFHEILNHMKNYYQIRRKISKRIEKIPEISGQFSEMDRTDGIKGIIDEDSWILIRRSNTEDVIRISAESNSVDRCKKNIDNIIKIIS